jgi:hypothetical protein
VITNAILSIVITVVGFFNGLFPSLTIPSWVSSDQIGSAVANYIGGMLAAISSWFPSAALVTILQGVVTLLPLVAGYYVAEWVWRHVPTIAGFGTGNG